MWTIAFFFGLILGGLVFAVGYGQVLLYNLVLRSMLVTLGSALTIVAARKATNVFITPPTSTVEEPPELGKVEIDEPDDQSEEQAPEPAEESSPEEQVGEALEAEDTSSDVGDDTDIGKLADMVSETMKEE